MNSKKIGILLHKDDPAFFSTKYLIRLLMEEWKGMGITVEVIQGTQYFVPTDLMIPHLDLTVTPKRYCRFMEQYSIVINRQVVDISKLKISPNLLRENDPYDGPVIVKTNRNFGGVPEKVMSASIASKFRSRFVTKPSLTRAIPMSWRDISYIKSLDYPVFPTLQKVPKEIFENGHLVVEKFLPETDGDNYHLRFYYFFGDRGINILGKSKDKIIKGRNIFQVEETTIPHELYSIRHQLGFDYGKFDYVLRDGKVVLFDVNRTPVYMLLERHQLAQKMASHLAEGIRSIL